MKPSKTGKKRVNISSKKVVKTRTSNKHSKTHTSHKSLKKHVSIKTKSAETAIGEKKKDEIIDSYNYDSKKIPIIITIKNTNEEYVPIYEVSISQISKTTELILEKIRQQLIKQVNLGIIEITDTKKTDVIEEKFRATIIVLVNKYFPDIDDNIKDFLISYLIQKSLGLGSLEILMDDKQLEEIVINSATEPVWVFHKKHGWLKTTITIPEEDQTRHYATMIGRKIGRQITVLEPLLDAHLDAGDRVNATLMPISTHGNTITFRKFSRDPMTITHFLRYGTLTPYAAALIWTAMQFEMSAIIAGGTASGKTSTLNVLATFFPPNQRIISIEDTREIRLPKFLHWVPMSTRLPNSEGKGEVSMEHLLVNSLRMRPDRILVGEVRRKREAETLFEAIHTGHSVYATFHSNTAEETVKRLTNPPINVPRMMLPAISMIIMQFRNRRTGTRRTFQIAEILPNAEANVLLQYDAKKDRLVQANKSKSLLSTLKLFTGFTDAEIHKTLQEKEKVLKYLVDMGIDTVDSVGHVIAEFYTNKSNLMKHISAKKRLG
ncbi:CpaF family protein [archaeon]|jgi:archaeal flagellar protein FlaI|nr:CpaF family protein [archaeon]MBT4648232.1 CpaF family protein [archaeon]MBT6822282.1 CpaF family protein [archaeon]MBT7392656.1 CpaF family protein [archaeon]